MTESPISVAFVPVYPNPYQQQLADALTHRGTQVTMLSEMPTSAWLRENVGQVQVLHLHWLYGIYMARFATPLRLTSFLRNLSLAQQLGYRIVWTAHNLLPHRQELRPLHNAMRSVIMRRADAVIVHCHFAEQELLRRYTRNGPIYVIPIGNQIGRFPVTMTAAEARSSLGLRPDQFVYLFLGLLAPYKGLDRLSHAFRHVAVDNDVLVIAGEALNERVSTEVAEAAHADARIHFQPGHVPDGEMQRYLLSANVLVAPYREVLTSSSATLGLSYGLPIIAPALGCLPEQVPPDAGLLYDPLSEEGLRRALQSIKDRNANHMRSAALTTAQELRWDDIGRQTAAVYRATLGL